MIWPRRYNVRNSGKRFSQKKIYTVGILFLQIRLLSTMASINTNVIRKCDLFVQNCCEFRTLIFVVKIYFSWKSFSWLWHYNSKTRKVSFFHYLDEKSYTALNLAKNHWIMWKVSSWWIQICRYLFEILSIFFFGNLFFIYF